MTSIETSTFEDNILSDVTIPDTITSIGESAFKDNSLTSVNIGSGITTVKANAFSDNESSLEICIEAAETNLTTIETNAFGGVTPTYDDDQDCTNN